MLTKRKPVHPGNLFKEEVLIPLGLTVTLAAAGLGVSRKALSEFLNGHSSLSPEMAIRIGKATKTSPESSDDNETEGHSTAYIPSSPLPTINFLPDKK